VGVEFAIAIFWLRNALLIRSEESTKGQADVSAAVRELTFLFEIEDQIRIISIMEP
jgi:hypothetical protein